jgi:hypothetical protein
MFLPVAGSKVSGKPVSPETMFREYLSPHCGWSSAETVEMTPKPQKKARISSRQSDLLPVGRPDCLSQSKHRAFEMQLWNSISGWRIIVSGNDVFFNDPTVTCLSSAEKACSGSKWFCLGNPLQYDIALAFNLLVLRLSVFLPRHQSQPLWLEFLYPSGRRDSCDEQPSATQVKNHPQTIALRLLAAQYAQRASERCDACSGHLLFSKNDQ